MTWSWPLVLLIITGVLCIGAIFRPKLLPLLILPALTWQNALSIGISLNPEKVLYPFIVLVFMLQKLVISREPQIRKGSRYTTTQSALPNREATKVAILVLLVLLSMCVFALSLSAQSQMIDLAPSRWQEPPLRGIVATLLWCGRILPLFVAAKWIRSPQMLVRCVHVFLLAMTATGIIGLLQWIGFYFLPPLHGALSYLSAYPGGSIAFRGLDGDLYYRISALCGEPRDFGFAMSLTAALVLLLNVFDVPNVPRWMKSSVLFFAFLILTLLSASASAVVAAASAFLALLLWLSRGKSISGRQGRQLLKTGIIAIGAILIVNWFGGHSGYFDRITSYFNSGPPSEEVGLLRSAMEIPVAHAGYLSWLASEPLYLVTGAGVGNGAFHAYDYLPPQSPFRYASMTYAQVGVVDLLSDIGLLGVTILGVIWLRWYRQIAARSRQLAGEQAAAVQVSLGMLVFLGVYLIIRSTLPFIWFFFGVAFGCSEPPSNNVRSDRTATRFRHQRAVLVRKNGS